MAKIDPALRFLETQEPFALRALAVDSVFEVDATTDETVVRALIEFEDLASCEAAGFKTQTVAGDVASGTMNLASLPELEQVEGLRRIEVAHALYKELDLALPETHASEIHVGPPGHRGAGVVVGTIDSGIDYTHQAFRRSDGSTRILAIWDQAMTPQGGEAHPTGFDYGVEYRKADIDRALTNDDPFSIVRHLDDQIPGDGFHGTHVTGIAAGDGSVAGGGQPELTFVGLAPEAEIVVVANNRGQAGAARGMGDSADTLDAVSYIFSIGQTLGRPVVINQSQGDNVGPHDGTSLLERGIDNLLGDPGRAMVKSAGNEGARNRHASGTVPAGGVQDVPFLVPGGRPFPLVIDIWYAGADRLDISITPPSGPASEVVSPGESNRLTLANGNSVFVDSDVDDAANHDNRIFVVVEAAPGSAIERGPWSLRLGGANVSDGKWDGWIQRGEPSPAFLPPLANPARTISIPGTSSEVITVASYITRGSGLGTISTFSSLGPTRDGRPAPTVAAPGQQLTAPQPEVTGDLYGPMSGTSMAAPAVTGAIALLLQKNRALTQAEIKACLQANARTDQFTADTPNNAWGAGKLDAFAAFGAVPERNGGPAGPGEEEGAERAGGSGANDTAYWQGVVGY
jgi:subtilisin family serine protease